MRPAAGALGLALLAACGGGGSSSPASVAASPPLATSVAAPAATAIPTPVPTGIRAVRTQALVLSHVGENGAADIPNLTAVGASAYDLVTVDEIGTASAAGKLATSDMLMRVRGTRAGRIVLGYVDLGEAEAWRSYFGAGWKVGSPSFILSTDPNGFSGDYPVLFTDARWRAIVYGSPASLVDRAIADGFDGVFLDWVAAYQFAPVIAADPAARTDMIAFVAAISAYAKARKPGFLIVPQNAADLLSDVRFANAIDAIGQEDLWFTSSGGADVATPALGVATTLAQLDASRAGGLPVFSIDYAAQPINAATAYAAATRHGYIEYVGARALNSLTLTPPPGV